MYYIDGTNVNEDTDDKNHETKLEGIVQNGYNVGSNTNFPNYPYYSWEYNYSGGVLTYNNKDMVDDDIEEGATVPNAMANVSFVSVDKSKSKALREIKLQYGNDAKAALKEEMQRLKQMGLAMAVEDDEDDDENPSYQTEIDLSGVDLDDFMDTKKEGKENRDDLQDKLDDLKDTTTPKENNPIEHHNGPYSRIHMPDYNKTNTGGKAYVTGNYSEPPKTEQDAEPYATTRRRKPFPERNNTGEGDSYQTYIDIMRLYHVASRTDMIDGLPVVTHVFELYMAIDSKTEVRIQPYLSSACLLYNFQPCLQEADLPQKKFIRPKSIYDNRYASVRHRHYDYERRIWELTLETDQVWKNFKRYITIDQGMDNKNKVMLTDSQGKIYAAEDNMVRHCEPTVTNPDTGELKRREGGRVLITSKPAEHTIENCSTPIQSSCVNESSITIDELYALKGIKGNIQDQIDNLWNGIDDIWDNIDDIWTTLEKLEEFLGDLIDALEAFQAAGNGDFVKRPGDRMTGGLWMIADNGSTYPYDEGFTGGIPAFGFVRQGAGAMAVEEGDDGEDTGSDDTGDDTSATNNDLDGYEVCGYMYGGTADCDIGWATGPGAGDWVVKWNKNFSINGDVISFGDVDGETGEYKNGNTYHINLTKLYEMMEANGYGNRDEN